MNDYIHDRKKFVEECYLKYNNYSHNLNIFRNSSYKIILLPFNFLVDLLLQVVVGSLSISLPSLSRQSCV